MSEAFLLELRYALRMPVLTSSSLNPREPGSPPYSYRSACIGSTREARRAGT
jgi:hypothetical protein